MKLVDDYFELQSQIFKYFGYVEDWRVIPIEDRREFYWLLDNESVWYSLEKDLVLRYEECPNGNLYQDEIYTQRHLPKYIYRGDAYSLICVDTHTDGNKFLAIFHNAKELAKNETAPDDAGRGDEYYKITGLEPPAR